jgi:hypothetical protein
MLISIRLTNMLDAGSVNEHAPSDRLITDFVGLEM